MRVLIAVGLLAAVLGGCESGWDLNGSVNATTVSAKERSLFVYLVTGDTLDAAHRPAAGSYGLLAQADSIPSQPLPVRYDPLGCPSPHLLVLAWSPRSAPPADPSGNPPFAPVAGDLVVWSDVRHPYCGWGTDPETINLVMTDADSE